MSVLCVSNPIFHTRASTIHLAEYAEAASSAEHAWILRSDYNRTFLRIHRSKPSYFWRKPIRFFRNFFLIPFHFFICSIFDIDTSLFWTLITNFVGYCSKNLSYSSLSFTNLIIRRRSVRFLLTGHLSMVYPFTCITMRHRILSVCMCAYHLSHCREVAND